MPARPQAPCLGCKDRVADPNCHTTCEKYIKFDTANKALRAERIRVAEANRVQNEIENRRIDMAKKHKFYYHRSKEK